MVADSITCPLCGSAATQEFFEARNVPAQDGVVWPTEQDALSSPSGDILLRFCTDCAYIWNISYDPARIRFTGYDFSLQHSPLFRKFAEQLARDLIDRYRVTGKTVLDIGCGQGHFLTTVCALGGNNGVGIDPSYRGEPGGEAGRGIRFISDDYGDNHAHLSGDLVICRHVLDELEDARGFLLRIRRALDRSPESVLYCEMPDAMYTFRNNIVWNVGYAKRAWFTATSLSRLVESCGFEILGVQTCYNGEYLGIEARPARQPHVPPRDRKEEAAILLPDIVRFAEEAKRVAGRWGEEVLEIRRSGCRAVAWGAGARAVNFFTLEGAKEAVAFLVDINPGRQGMYMPRTGLRIESPEILKEFRPGLLIVTNPTYAGEIMGQAHAMGLACRFMAL